MLTIEEILGMAASGQQLPQERQRQATLAEQIVLQGTEAHLLNQMLELSAEDKDPLPVLLDNLEGLASSFGWYAVSSCLCAAFAARFTPEQVPDLPSLTDETKLLLGCLSVAAVRQDSDPGAWTIPMAMLADLGENGALAVTACAAFCAAHSEVERMAGECSG
jgi:hypothetical protein